MATTQSVQRTAPTETGASSNAMFHVDPELFRKNFNVSSFQFNHSLVGHPLFEIPRLARLGERMLKLGQFDKFVSKSGKGNAAGSKFTDMAVKEQVAATIEQLHETGAWMKLSSSNAADPEYDELMQDLLKALEQLAGYPLRREISWAGLTVFMASPNIVTPYHMDHESNFLSQVSGSKMVSLFDPNDRTLLTEPEVEDFYAGNFEAARFAPEYQARGIEYQLVPGTVVHHPPMAPHWVRNGDNVSISVSMGFCLRPLDRTARVYQVNHYLRKLGMQPTPPGKSLVKDRIKMAGVGLISKSSAKEPGEILYSGVDRVRWVGRKLRGKHR